MVEYASCFYKHIKDIWTWNLKVGNSVPKIFRALKMFRKSWKRKFLGLAAARGANGLTAIIYCQVTKKLSKWET